MFGKENYHVVDGIAHENPHTVNGKQVEVVYDDGRHFLRTTREKFDIITSDPIDPWVKGCAALNTVEYYQMCRDHLNPGGSVSLWIPLYESNLETTKSVIATFFQVFPHGIMWSNERDGHGYDAVLFGQVEPTVINVDDISTRLDRPDHQRVKQSLREVGFGEVKESTGGGTGGGHRPARHLRGTGALDEGMVARCPDQHRPQPAAPVPGRNVVEFRTGRPDPLEHPWRITASLTRHSSARRRGSRR